MVRLQGGSRCINLWYNNESESVSYLLLLPDKTRMLCSPACSAGILCGLHLLGSALPQSGWTASRLCADHSLSAHKTATGYARCRIPLAQVMQPLRDESAILVMFARALLPCNACSKVRGSELFSQLLSTGTLADGLSAYQACAASVALGCSVAVRVLAGVAGRGFLRALTVLIEFLAPDAVCGAACLGVRALARLPAGAAVRRNASAAPAHAQCMIRQVHEQRWLKQHARRTQAPQHL